MLDKRSIQAVGWQDIVMNPDNTVNEHFRNSKVLNYCWNSIPEQGGDEVPYKLANAGYPIILCKALLLPKVFVSLGIKFFVMAKLHFRPYIPNQTVLFPQRIDENIVANDPVRIVNAVIDNLNLESFKKLYKETGRCPYHPKMMLKVIIYAYMNNNIYSCRKIEKHLLRDIHYIWLAGNEHPDFITINRFRNRVKEEINNVFTQLVLVLADKGFISLDVEYIDGTKIESKANKYTFVWRKTVEQEPYETNG